MKIALLIFVVAIVLGIVAYFLLFPPNTFISILKPGGGAITFSRTSVSVESAPDHYPTNAFDYISPYIARLIVPTNHFKYLHIFTPDGMRGFSLNSKDGVIAATLNLEWRQEQQREIAIRAFFNSLRIAPSRDNLAGNGGVLDATRILEYPVTGDAAELTALTKRILQELCGISPNQALDISYEGK